MNRRESSSNETQSTKWETYTLRFYRQREKYFDIQSLELHLTFACLRETPPAKVLVRRAGATAKAGILKFEYILDFRVTCLVPTMLGQEIENED
jgi:hypothetical protein